MVMIILMFTTANFFFFFFKITCIACIRYSKVSKLHHCNRNEDRFVYLQRARSQWKWKIPWSAGAPLTVHEISRRRTQCLPLGSLQAWMHKTHKLKNKNKIKKFKKLPVYRHF